MFIKRNEKGQFLSTKGNQFAKGNPPNRTSFKKGERAGSNNNTWKGGLQLHKRDGYYVYIGVGKRMRRARFVWENTHGKIPKGLVIYHKDGDRFNDEIENLEMISRAELKKRNNK
jgi:hypothetical protein